MAASGARGPGARAGLALRPARVATRWRAVETAATAYGRFLGTEVEVVRGGGLSGARRHPRLAVAAPARRRRTTLPYAAGRALGGACATTSSTDSGRPDGGRGRPDARGREFVDVDGRPVPADAPFVPRSVVWAHRDLPDEAPLPDDVEVLHRDERLVVVDKPHHMATMPRGRHVVQSALARTRVLTGLPRLTPRTGSTGPRPGC